MRVAPALLFVPAFLIAVALVLTVTLKGCHPKPPPRQRIVLALDATGQLRDSTGVVVGFTDGTGKHFASVSRDARPVPLEEARIGYFARTSPLYRLRPVEMDELGLFFGDATVAGLADGRAIAQVADGRWRPASDPPAGGRSRVDFDDGTHWVSLRFATDADPLERERWVEPAHSSREIAARARELASEAQGLPPKIRAATLRALPVIALVSTVEGSFGDIAQGPHDTSASVGIFQWATMRDQVADPGSSLARFVTRLKERAAARDPLARAAWRQCQAEGIDVRRGQLLLNGRRARGAEIEPRLAQQMRHGPLRRYQLVAALDWIQDVQATVVRPGVWGKRHLWPEYSEAEGGRTVTLGARGRSLTLHAPRPATVGYLLRSPPALATVVNLGVNRPHFVEAALWQALTPSGDATGRVGPLLDAALAGGDGARDAIAALTAIIWPAPRAEEVSEESLLDDVKRCALALYRPVERGRRARRLATSAAD